MYICSAARIINYYLNQFFFCSLSLCRKKGNRKESNKALILYCFIKKNTSLIKTKRALNRIAVYYLNIAVIMRAHSSMRIALSISEF